MRDPLNSLTKKELKHLLWLMNWEVSFKRTVSCQEIDRKRGSIEPCWECKSIAQKVGMI